MSTIEALEIALKKEEASIQLYKDMLVKHKDINELFSFLLNEEYKHRKLVQDKLVELKKY